MAVAPYKYFRFDGESSRDYDVYLTGEGVYNAPSRAVEMKDIPGRNGSFAIDQGRYNNLTVTYKGGIIGTDQEEFAAKMDAFRNWICSKVGYKRLEDDYNPDEYRMAVYSSGLSVSHENLKAGEFEISFDCKPQRWLKSGETAVSVTSGDEVDNPTLFDAEPLLAVKGYGEIAFNGYEINLVDAVLGKINIAENDKFDVTKTYSIDDILFNNNDILTISGNFEVSSIIQQILSGGGRIRASAQSVSDTNTSFITGNTSFSTKYAAQLNSPIVTNFNDFVVFGTNKTITNTVTVSVSCETDFIGNGTVTFILTQTIDYDAANGTITVSIIKTRSSTNPRIEGHYTGTETTVSIVGDSTASALGNPTYIDCEIGEAYMYKNGKVVSCNSAVALGSDLPKLASGTNEITFDNTVTELKIHSRWWRI